jgi:hypothetical protein
MKPFLSRFAASSGALALAVLTSAVPAWAAHEASATGPAAAPAAAAPPTQQRAARDAYDGPPLLLGNGKQFKLGGYGSLGGAYTRLMGRDSGLMSLEAAFLLDHRLSLGVVGYGFTRTPSGPDAIDGTRQQFGAGYGGVAVRYSVFSGLPVYGTFGVVLGAGVVSLHRDNGWDDDDDWGDGWDGDDDDEHDLRSVRIDPFLFVQPEVALNANVTRWLRLGATLGYRFTGGVGRFGLEEADLNGIVAGGNIQVGWF